MSSALGTLVAKAILDTSEFTAGADKAERTAARAASAVDGSLKKMEASTKLAIGGIAASIAAGFGIAALKNKFDEYVDSAAKADEISRKFGLSVEWLSSISPIAKTAGLSMDDLGGAVGKFAKSLVSSTEETKGARKALGFLGIDAKDSTGKLKEAGDLVEEIAQKFGELAPSLERTAIAKDLFGKSGESMTKFLDDLAKYGAQDIKMTTEQAALAEEYKDDIVRLGIAKGALAKIISAELLPVGSALIKTFLQMQSESTGLRDEAKRLAADGSIQEWAVMGVSAIAEVINAGHGLIIVVEAMGKTLGYLAATATTSFGTTLDAMKKLTSGDVAGAAAAVSAGMKSNAENGAAFRKELEALYGQQLAGDKIMDRFRDQLERVNQGLENGETAAKKSANGYADLAENQKNGAEKEDEFAKVMEDANKRIAVATAALLDPFGKLLASEKALLELQASDKWAGFTDLKKRGAIAANEHAAALERQHKTILASEKTLEEYNKHQEKMNTDAWAGVAELEKSLEQKEIEIATYGLTKSAVTEYTAGLLEARAANLAVDASATSQVAALREQAKAMRALAGKEFFQESKEAERRFNEDMLRESQQTYDSISSYFVDSMQSGFKNVWSDFLNLSKRMLAEKIVVPVIMQAIGLGGTGSGGGISGLLNSIGGLAGSSGFSGVSNFIGGFTGAVQGPTLTGAALGGNAAAAGSGLSEMLSMAGPYVAAAAALYTLYRTLVKPRGGAKEEGGSWQTFDATGSLTGSAGFGNAERFHRGNLLTGQDASNAAARDIVGGITASYFSVIKALGGTARGFTVGLDFDTDPKGTANSRIWGSVNDADGNSLRRSALDAGRGEAALNAGLQIESQRMLLTLIRESPIPAAIKTMFDAIDIETITGDSATKFLDQVQQYAAAYQQLRNSLDDIDAAIASFGGDSTAQFKRGIDKLRDNVAEASLAFDEAMASNDPTAQIAAQQALMAAVNTRYETEMRLITEVRGALDNIKNSAYEFRIQMANRINAAGGTRDIAGISQSRLAQLDGEFAGSTPERRLRLVNESLAALDNYQAEMARRRQAEAQAAQAGQQAMANAQRASITMQIDGLNKELSILQNMASLRDRAAESIKSLTYSGANPLSAQGRFALAGGDVAALQAAFRTATGDRQAALGNQLVDALNQRFSISNEINQRSSDEALALFNETVSGLAEVRDVAQTEAERALGLQARIATLQEQANSIADYGNAIAQDVGGVLDQGLIDMYTRLEEIGNTAYEQQQTQTQEQFDYLKTQTELQRDSRAELQRIREAIEKGNDAPPVTVVVNAPSGTTRGNVIVMTPDELAATVQDGVSQYIAANGSRLARVLAASN